MEKDMRLNIENNSDDEEGVLTLPYYVVTYVDDYNRTHIATIKDTLYLHFIEDRFFVKDCTYFHE